MSKSCSLESFRPSIFFFFFWTTESALSKYWVISSPSNSLSLSISLTTSASSSLRSSNVSTVGYCFKDSRTFSSSPIRSFSSSSDRDTCFKPFEFLITLKSMKPFNSWFWSIVWIAEISISGIGSSNLKSAVWRVD